MENKKLVVPLLGAITMLSWWVLPQVSLNKDNILNHLLQLLNITKM